MEKMTRKWDGKKERSEEIKNVHCSFEVGSNKPKRSQLLEFDAT